jgi:hypothetical protein
MVFDNLLGLFATILFCGSVIYLTLALLERHTSSGRPEMVADAKKKFQYAVYFGGAGCLTIVLKALMPYLR